MAERFNASVLKTEVLKSTVGSNPTLSSIKMDIRETNHKRFNAGKRKPSLPIKPEENPPESLEEIESLIFKLTEKVLHMKLQLEDIAEQENKGIIPDYRKVKAILFAKTKTNQSITALQKIAKAKREERSVKEGFKFEKLFMLVTRETLDLDTYKRILNITKERYKGTEPVPEQVI